ncbi:MAG: hypothetical protein KF757_11780 [Phycisphaeraceae bacterium]|nr:hypothetical protein [Phycisphaeraceae bacterium]MCW5762371.1 hypothetical protein [Phycisphaeraceae bacterium]
MDDRIKDLKEGAGREESRLNQDFIDFLQKWSSPVLLLIAGVAVAYWGWGQYKTMQVAKVNEASREYASASETGNPDRLGPVAEKYKNVRSFGLLAKLDLADVYLLSAQRGLAPGLVYLGTENLMEGDVLDEDARRSNLDKAARLYREVLDAAGKGREQLGVEAAFGLAAVAESLDDVDGARRHLDKAREIATSIGYDALALAASARMDRLASLAERPRLYDAASLPTLPTPKAPEIRLPDGTDFLLSPDLDTEPGDQPADDAEASDGGGESGDGGDGGGADDDGR